MAWCFDTLDMAWFHASLEVSSYWSDKFGDFHSEESIAVLSILAIWLAGIIWFLYQPGQAITALVQGKFRVSHPQTTTDTSPTVTAVEDRGVPEISPATTSSTDLPPGSRHLPSPTTPKTFRPLITTRQPIFLNEEVERRLGNERVFMYGVWRWRRIRPAEDHEALPATAVDVEDHDDPQEQVSPLSRSSSPVPLPSFPSSPSPHSPSPSSSPPPPPPHPSVSSASSPRSPPQVIAARPQASTQPSEPSREEVLALTLRDLENQYSERMRVAMATFLLLVTTSSPGFEVPGDVIFWILSTAYSKLQPLLHTGIPPGLTFQFGWFGMIVDFWREVLPRGHFFFHHPDARVPALLAGLHRFASSLGLELPEPDMTPPPPPPSQPLQTLPEMQCASVPRNEDMQASPPSDMFQTPPQPPLPPTHQPSRASESLSRVLPTHGKHARGTDDCNDAPTPTQARCTGRPRETSAHKGPNWGATLGQPARASNPGVQASSEKGRRTLVDDKMEEEGANDDASDEGTRGPIQSKRIRGSDKAPCLPQLPVVGKQPKTLNWMRADEWDKLTERELLELTLAHVGWEGYFTVWKYNGKLCLQILLTDECRHIDYVFAEYAKFKPFFIRATVMLRWQATAPCAWDMVDDCPGPPSLLQTIEETLKTAASMLRRSRRKLASPEWCWTMLFFEKAILKDEQVVAGLKHYYGATAFTALQTRFYQDRYLWVVDSDTEESDHGKWRPRRR